MAQAHDPRTIEVPTELLERAKAALAEFGPKRGAERLGISRNALLGIAATGRAMAGTVSLMKQAAPEQRA